MTDPFLKTGASIKWCDIDKFTWLSTKEDYLSKITKNTKAIIVVHLYGAPSNIYEIYDELRSKNIKIIEDRFKNKIVLSRNAKIKNC